MKGTAAEAVISILFTAFVVIGGIIGAIWLNDWYRNRAIECGFCGTADSNPACCLPVPVTR